ncbi:MAG: hypothetical protein KAU99_05655 [Thermoplasmata archaeon]|nr:hypothetical protein [Thermoplasmata archaeon]
MKKEFDLEGSTYSNNKADFKRILRKHGLRWKGSLGNFEWIGRDDKVTAYFDRDEQKGITLNARLVWEGKKKSDFLSELTDWIKSLHGAPVRRGGLTKDTKQKIQRELEFWDKIHEPSVEAMKAEGRPESWITKDLEEWKAKRKEKEKELKRKYS